MLSGTVTSLAPALPSVPTLWSDLGSFAAVILASIASGAAAFPMARFLGVSALFRRFRRADPELAAATLIACASLVQKPGFNAAASAPTDPLLNRAVLLSASEASPEEARAELAVDPPTAPRPIIAWAPVVGLAIALGGLGVVGSAASCGLISGPPVAIALVIALYVAFFLSAAANAADDRASRLDPADVLTRALICAAVPAIRAGADSGTVEQILRPMLSPEPAERPAGRLAA